MGESRKLAVYMRLLYNALLLIVCRIGCSQDTSGSESTKHDTSIVDL